MKVLHLISSTGLFGAENMVIQLLRELGKSKSDVYLGIVENRTESHLIIAEEAKKFIKNVKTFPCIHKFDLKSLFLLKKFIKDNKIDLIHSHKYKTNFYCYLATLPKKIPIVSTCHNWISESFKMKMYEWFDKKILAKFDRVVAVSDEVEHKILESGIPQNRVLKIKNGINVQDYSEIRERENIRTELGIDKDSIVIGNVGRLDDNKGIDNLLKVTKALAGKYEDILLLIVGDGPSGQKFQKNAKALGIEQKLDCEPADRHEVSPDLSSHPSRRCWRLRRRRRPGARAALGLGRQAVRLSLLAASGE